MIYTFDFETGVVAARPLGLLSHGATDGATAVPQLTVTNRTYVGALLRPDSAWALTGAENAPGYDPRDVKMVSDNATLVKEFYAAFPDSKALIDRLLSF